MRLAELRVFWGLGAELLTQAYGSWLAHHICCMLRYGSAQSITEA